MTALQSLAKGCLSMTERIILAYEGYEHDPGIAIQ